MEYKRKKIPVILYKQTQLYKGVDAEKLKE